MKRNWLIGGAVVTAGIALLVSRGQSQEKKDKPDSPAGAPDMAAMMKKWKDAMTPGEHHKKLDVLVGEWDTKMKVSMGGPGAPPTITEGKAKVKWIMDGRFLREEYEGDLMMPGPTGEMTKKKMKGLGLTGYDNFRHLYTGSWVDNMNTYLLTMTGMMSPDGKTLTSYGAMDEPMLDVYGRTVKYETKIIDDDKHVFTIYDLHAGEDYKAVEIEYTRAK